MGRSSLVLSMMAAACVGLPAWGQGTHGSQSEYTVPARTRLFSATLSGLTDAYRILDRGVKDDRITGDRRELVFLHVLARAGLLVFDRDDVAVQTSLIEILEPFGITLTGDTFNPTDRADPDAVRLHWPTDPADPNRLKIPPTADPAAAADAINTAILPEIDRLVADLATVGNTPTFFGMTLTMFETGLSSAVEVDYADVLALKAVLLGAKTLLYASANNAYDLTVDLTDPIFAGWERGVLPATTTINTILNAYPSLLRIVPSTGAQSLAQTKKNLLETLTAADAALASMASETDDQKNDLLRADPEEPDYLRVKSELDKLRTSLSNGTAATYSLGAKEGFTLRQNGQDVGQMGLEYDPFRRPDSGWIELFAVNGGPSDLPYWWDIDWFNIDGTRIEGDAEAYTGWESWYGWFEGTVSADGSQITNMTFRGWWNPITGLSAQRTINVFSDVQFNPNPVFAGKVSPRDVLPQFGPDGEPVPGTMGHALGNDASLGGLFPNLTQQDWMPRGFEVWGGNVDYTLWPWWWDIFNNIDQYGYTRLGQSDGGPLTISGRYDFYLIGARGQFLLDSIQGSTGDYYDGYPYTGDVLNPQNIYEAPDNQYAIVGENDFLNTDLFIGYVLVANPGDWTGLTVVTALPPSGRSPVYRFWSPVQECHFYTIDEQEKDMLVRDFPHVWTFEGTAYYAMPDGSDPCAVPVYRFWSPVYSSHFYTISESERDGLLRDFPGTWTLEGPAYYVFPEGRQPPDAGPVYRFWSPVKSHHFYTIGEQEKDNLIRDFSHVWSFEGIAWYAYPP